MQGKSGKIEEKNMDLLGGNVRKAYFKYLATGIGAALIFSVYSIVDCIMVGQYQGPDGSSALAIVMPIWTTVLSMGILAGTGGAVLMAKLRGENKKAEGDEYFTVSTVLCAFLTVLVWLAVLIFPSRLLSFFGASENILPHALAYIKWLKYFIPLFTFGQLITPFIRNDNAPSKAMIAVISGGVFNIIGDYVLVFVCDMGIEGAGLATSLGQMLTIGILCTHFFSKKCTLRFAKVSHVFKKAFDIIKIGFPVFIVDIAVGITVLIFNNRIMHYLDEDALAVYGVIVNINYFVQCVAYGIGQAAQPVLSVNYGAMQYDRVKKASRYAWITAAVAGVVFLSVAEIMPMQLLRIFMKTTPQVEQIAPDILRTYCICYLIVPLNILSTYYLQAIMKAGASLIVSLLRSVILSSILLFAMPAIAGKDSLWYVMNIVEAVTFAVMIIIAAVYEKKLFSKSGGKVPEPKVRALDSKETDA